MYSVLLELHSWCRWVVLLALGMVLARGWWGMWTRRPWRPSDSVAARLWVGATDTQLMLGMALYLVGSPLAAMARHDLRAAWGEPSLRFFGLLHPALMALAVASTHATWVWARRAAHDEERFWRLVRGVVATALLISLAMPWPFLAYGRPLVRA